MADIGIGIKASSGAVSSIGDAKDKQETKKSLNGIKSQLKEINEGVSHPESITELGEKILSQLKIISQSITSENAAPAPKSNESNGFGKKKDGLQATKDAVSEVVPAISQDEEVDDGGAEAKASPTPTSKVDINDLKDLSSSTGLGFAVLYWKLDEISSKLGDGKKSNKGNKGKGIGSFFTGLLKGAAGLALIAVALIAFAGALNIFNGLEWGPALAGCASFAIFTLAMVGIAKIVGKETVTFIKFAVGATILSGALALFGLSLYIVGGVFSGQALTVAGVEILPAVNIGGAIGGIASFLVFTLACVGLSKLVSKNTRSFANFAKGAFFMAAALGVFGLSIGVVGTIMSGGNFLGISFPPGALLPALEGIGLFAIFATAVAGLSHLISKEKKNWVNFAIGASLMSLALSAFALGVIIPSKVFSDGFKDPFFGITLQADPAGAIAGVLTFSVFALSMAALAKVVGTQVSTYAKMFAATTIMSLSLIGLSIAIGLVALIATGGGGEVGSFKIPESVNFGSAMAGLGMVTIFLVAFTAMSVGLTVIAPFVTPGLAILAGISGVILLTGLAMAAMAAVVGGGTITNPDTGETTTQEGISLGIIENYFGLLNGVILGFSTIGWGAAAAALGKSVILAPMCALITAIAGCLTLTILASKAIDALGTESLTLMFVGLDVIIENLASIPATKAGKALWLSVILTPLSALITLISTVLITTATASQVIKKIGGIDDTMFDGFLVIVQKLGKLADEMGKNQIKLTKTLARSLIPIIHAIDKMTNLVIKIASFASDGENSKAIDSAMVALEKIVGSGHSGLIGMVNLMANELDTLSRKTIKTIKSITFITDAIKGTAEVVQITADIDSTALNRGLFNIEELGKFLINTAKSLSTFEIDKTTLKKVKNLSSIVNGTGKYKDSGILQLVTGISQLSKEAPSSSEIPDLFSSLIKSLQGFNSIDKKAIKNLKSLGKVFKNFKIESLGNSMSMFTSSFNEFSKMVQNTENSPFELLADGIDRAQLSLINFNMTMYKTVGLTKSLINEVKKMPRFSEKNYSLGDNSSENSNSSRNEDNSLTPKDRETLVNLEKNQKEMKKTLEEITKIFKDIRSNGMLVNMKNGFSI